MTEVSTPSRTRVRVWDVPTRLVHWLMVVLVGVSWWTAENGHLDYHQWSGYGLLGLLIFRIYWGLAGSSTARFSQFVRGPRAIASYLAGKWSVVPGHSPIGALSVIALLLLLFAQIVLGLFAVDIDGIASGPLSIYVSFDTGRVCAQLHHKVFDLLLWLIALHILAVLYYSSYKKENLIGAMLHGNRNYPAVLPAVRVASSARLISGVVLAAVITWMISRAFQLF